MKTIEIKFNSKETPNHVYSLFVKSLQDAIRLNANDPIKLEEIRLQLEEHLAVVEQLKYRGGK